MSNIARLTDATTGSCAIHGPQSGTITSSASTTYVDGKLVARTTDTVTAACGDTGTISATGRSTIVEGQAVACGGDAFSGVYSGTINDPGTTVKEG